MRRFDPWLKLTSVTGYTLRRLYLISSTEFKENFLRFSGTLATNGHEDGARQPRVTRISRGALWSAALLRRFYLSAIKLVYRFSKNRRERRKTDGMSRTVRMIFADFVHSVRNIRVIRAIRGQTDPSASDTDASTTFVLIRVDSWLKILRDLRSQSRSAHPDFAHSRSRPCPGAHR